MNSCKQKLQNKDILPLKNDSSVHFDNETIESSKSIPEIQIQKIKQSMTEFEIANTIFVSDTIENNFSRLIGKVDKWTERYHVMFPDTLNNKVIGIYRMSATLWIIPFYLDGDMETQLFTMWKANRDSTLSYIGKINPSFNAKYSHLRILQHVTINKNETLFIGKTYGGEGGEIWESLWTANYNGKGYMSKTDHFETGYNDGENSNSIDYIIEGKSISIFLKVDSLIYKEDTTIVIPKSRKLVKEMELY